jgi:hypothetical protein
MEGLGRASVLLRSDERKTLDVIDALHRNCMWPISGPVHLAADLMLEVPTQSDPSTG